MNTLLLLTTLFAGTSGLVGLLIQILVLAIIFAVIFWILTLIPLPPPFGQIVRVVCAVIALIFLIYLLAGLAGCSTDPVTGKRTLDPNVRNQLLAVAQAEAHALTQDYLLTGNVDFKRDLISGALSQVYTLEGTATPATQASVSAAVGSVITEPKLKAAVTNAALNTINAAPAGTAKTVAINSAVIALDAYIANLAASP